ncbi:general substrate transporter [Phyllosticta citrichinensis]|uniref:General substrate transporter n=1 Tax=Phyllosticta citrichinensis TaxID=1130410 RepID=A0ABR1XV04_9PEZI
MTKFKIKYPWACAFCAFAVLGACLYGYDGVYFNGDIFVQHFGTRKSDGTYKIPPSELSVMTSMINVGEFVGSLSAAPLNDYLGRKPVFLIASAMIVAGVILQVTTVSNRDHITGGRAVLGFGVGAFSSTSPLYIAVRAFSRVGNPLTRIRRWPHRAFEVLSSCAGSSRCMESNKTPTAYRVPIGFQLVFPGLVFALIYFVPESPRWLVRQGKEREAVRSLQAIRRGEHDYDPQGENPVERRKLIYSAGSLIAQQINGIQWFYYFGPVFAKEIGLSDPFMMTVIAFVIQVVVVFAAVLCANKIPRRPLLLTTGILMTISIFIVGCLGIPGNNVSKTNGKVIISFVILEICSFNFSYGPLGWTIASEMAVGRNRNKIYAIAVACFWVTVWATVFTLPYLYYSAGLGPKTGFVYTGLCFITLAYVYFCVGEVTGRTMEEINGFFTNGVPAKSGGTSLLRDRRTERRNPTAYPSTPSATTRSSTNTWTTRSSRT